MLICHSFFFLGNFSFSGNVDLREGNGGSSRTGTIVGSSLGAVVLLIATIMFCYFLCKRKNHKKRYTDQGLILQILFSPFLIFCEMHVAL